MIENIYEKWLKANKQLSTDTRRIEKGGIFLALKGENFNGNNFAIQALEQGAQFAVIDEKPANFEQYKEKLILVEDCLKTLQDLARFHRLNMPARIICLTGSNGKTTTKELIYTALSCEYKVLATEGNLNNHIGVPLTLLNLREIHEFGIIELGANHQNEIELLANIALPDLGYITNFGKAHLEGFGGIEGVIKGKSELYDHLRIHNKTALVNQEDLKQIEMSAGIKSVFNFDTDLKLETATPYIGFTYKKEHYTCHLFGDYNFTNVRAAFSLALYFGINPFLSLEALANYEPQNNRSQIVKQDQLEIILDAYNANPSSVTNALNMFDKKSGVKSVILGDMLELGVVSRDEHAEIVEKAEKLGFKFQIFIGPEFIRVKPHANSKSSYFFENKSNFDKSELKSQIWQESNSILIKGSRGMRMEELIK
ncbi:UDP-N-acetylmuramoyl-tripeptide--D-alanyl-D-alanine ligase [Flavobacteriaceae bacterium]|nr:UDP-N-acetylmuramoyl-tripeptide--D-alanyl-D-alanine ligase [Flavobacteriaceae bacterium]